MAISRAEPGKTRVGWIGTGVMGKSMCGHLISKGYKTTVYNRSRDKAQTLLDAGATWADTPRQVAERSDVVFAIVGFPKDVREVFLGPQGALEGRPLTPPGVRGLRPWKKTGRLPSPARGEGVVATGKVTSPLVGEVASASERVRGGLD